MATPVWAWQDGTPTDDGLNAIAMGPDGSYVWAGYAGANTSTADSVSARWAAMKLDAHGTVVWKWENATAGYGDNRINAAVMGQDGSIALAGFGGDDFHVVKLDADGGLLWHFQDGSGDKDCANGISIGDDGSVVVVGTVSGDWHIPNLGSTDMAAFKLDADGTLLWKWQDGTVGHDLANAVAMAEDGSVVIAGYSRGDLMGRSVVGDDDSSFIFPQWLGGDFAAVKLDSGGAEVWRWQDGGSGFDRLNAVSMAENGSCVVAGYTTGDWDGEYHVGGDDFAAAKLDADGNEVWRWQDGTVDDDWLQAAEVQADGTIVLGGHTGGDWSMANAGGRDFAVMKLDPHGEEIWRWQGGSADTGETLWDDELNAMAVGSDGRIILAGRTCGSWGQTNLGEGDYMGLMLQALSSQSPTAAPSPAAAPIGRSAAPSAASPTLGRSSAPTPGSGRPLSTPPPLRSTPTPSIDFLPTPASSDTTSIVAGVISAVAGIAVIVLGVFFRKRQIAKRNNASRQPPLPVVAEDGGNDQPTLQENPQPPPSEDAHVLSSATAAVAAVPADNDDGGEGIEQPFPPAFAGVVEPLAEPTAQGEEDAGGDGAGGDGGGGGGDYGRGGGSSVCGDGVLLVEGGTMLPKHDSKDASGGDGSDRGRKALGTGSAEPSIHAGEDSIGGGGGGGGDGGSGVALQGVYPKRASAEKAFTVTTSTTNLSTGERDAFPPAYDGGGVAGPALVTEESKQTLHAVGTSSLTGRRASSVGLGTGRAVAESALALASSSQIPGVGDAAAAVSILVNLLMDNQDNKISTEASLRRCRSIVTMLERASKVLGKGGETTGKAERAMMEDVHDAVFDLAELIKTYQSKNRLAQLLTSTLFRRRQDEMGAVVDRAILGLQLGLHVQVGTDVNAVKRDVIAFKEGMQLFQGSIDEAQGKSRAEARRARRQRKLDQIEIPEDHVTITNELLGKGGFGEVYLADYNGRNAAAKVLHINHDLGRRDENVILDRSAEGHLRKKREETQRKAFLIELGTMIRLRSPYTVNVYGAVTSAHDRLVLVMELLAGGDLRTLLKNAEQPLPLGQSRQIVGDICAGMAFLHSKKTVHGDLKSANVLLDGAGRAKIGDFGTSRWVQHTMSTGLATFTTKSSQNTQMSLAWSAPEVLEADGSTYASDVYSFGIVVWEVLSRELPWVTVTRPKDIYIRVVLKNMRPVIPDDAPAQIADVARSCWAGEPGDRPTFSFILEGMKSNGWNE